MILFGPKDKVSCLEKLVFRSGVSFLFLFVLTDAILLKLDLQKRTLVLDNSPNGKLFAQQKCIKYPKIGNVYLIFNTKSLQDSVRQHSLETFEQKKLNICIERPFFKFRSRPSCYRCKNPLSHYSHFNGTFSLEIFIPFKARTFYSDESQKSFWLQ